MPDEPDEVPQQPTKEDLDVARKLLANIRFVDDDEDPDPAIELIAAALQSERSAATDKARREAFAECAKIARGGEIADHVDCGHEVGYRVGRLDAEAAIRALTPQNPGDAAHE